MDIFDSLKTLEFNIQDHNPNTKHWGMNHPHTEETKRLISMAIKGTKRSPEVVEKIRLLSIGRKQPEIQKNKVAEALSKKWLVTDPQGNQFEITNLRKFCVDNKLDQGNMVKVSQGIIKQNKGWKCIKL